MMGKRWSEEEVERLMAASLQFRDQRSGGAVALDLRENQWKPLWGAR